MLFVLRRPIFGWGKQHEGLLPDHHVLPASDSQTEPGTPIPLLCSPRPLLPAPTVAELRWTQDLSEEGPHFLLLYPVPHGVSPPHPVVAGDSEACFLELTFHQSTGKKNIRAVSEKRQELCRDLFVGTKSLTTSCGP